MIHVSQRWPQRFSFSPQRSRWRSTVFRQESCFSNHDTSLHPRWNKMYKRFSSNSPKKEKNKPKAAALVGRKSTQPKNSCCLIKDNLFPQRPKWLLPIRLEIEESGQRKDQGRPWQTQLSAPNPHQRFARWETGCGKRVKLYLKEGKLS